MNKSKIGVGDVIYSSREDMIFEVVAFGREHIYSRKYKKVILSKVIYYIHSQGTIGAYANNRYVLKDFTKIGNL